MIRPQAIVFDFFGVICSEIAPFWLAERFEESVAASIKAGLIGRADKGEISQAAMFEELARLTAEEAEDIEADWHSRAKIDQVVVDIVTRLHGRYKTCLLTNSPSPLVRSLLEVNNLNRLFDLVVVSSECGMAKPDRGIYGLVLQGADVEPAHALMIDDNPVNVAGARAAGMAALLFTSPSDLTGLQV